MPVIDFTQKDAHWIPCRIFDAAGVEHERVTRCNTETGEIEKYIPDPNNPDLLVIEGDHAAVESLVAPAPLTIKEW